VAVASAGSVCTSLQADNHASTPPLSFLQAGCPSCRPTNSVKALKAIMHSNAHKHGKRAGTSRLNIGYSTNSRNISRKKHNITGIHV